MNNEKKLYDLIKQHNGMLVMHDVEVAKILGVSRYSVTYYKKKLKTSGYIDTKVRVIDGKPVTLYKIIAEYTGEIKW